MLANIVPLKAAVPATLHLRSKKSAGLAKRHASEEIGDEPPAKINKLTGRPIRQSAGRKSLEAGFVKTSDVVDLSEDEPSGEDDEGRVIRPRKRLRSPSPPPLSSPIPDFQDENVGDDIQPLYLPSSMGVAQDVGGHTFTFRVPQGNVGAFLTKLDLDSILTTGASFVGSPFPTAPASGDALESHIFTVKPASRRSRSNRKKITLHSKTSEKTTPAGFLNLPGELRNKIYRLILVDEKPFDFHSPSNFQHSSALLRTCHQVHKEGSEILYSENKFMLERQNKVRGNYWTPVWTEVGFKDIRQFLHTIGPVNISHLRKVFLLCEDATPSANPNLTTAEERRFVHDENLIQCLKLLAYYGRLKTFSISVHGRKHVHKTDIRFLENLRLIQADKVKFEPHPRWSTFAYAHRYYGRKNLIDASLEKDLVDKMQRATKLYSDLKKRKKKKVKSTN